MFGLNANLPPIVCVLIFVKSDEMVGVVVE